MALIGQLNKRITFEMPSYTVNDSGGREVTYTGVFTVWAQVKKTSGARSSEAGIVGLDGSNDFIVRKSTDTQMIDKNWIIKYNNKSFAIHNIEQVGEENFYYRITGKDREEVESNSSS